jgi:nitrite reductase (NO-forming)
MPHDVALPVFGIQSTQVSRQGDTTDVSFEIGAEAAGAFPYYCTVIGHRQAGMEGRLVVGDEPGSE